MILAIIIEMDVVLVSHLLRQILYPENEETTGDGANGGGGKRNLNVVERLVLFLARPSIVSGMSYPCHPIFHAKQYL